MTGYYGSQLGDFRVGMRVELHPATDLWMSGVRYGEVAGVGRKLVHVQFDRLTKVRNVRPELLRLLEIP